VEKIGEEYFVEIDDGEYVKADIAFDTRTDRNNGFVYDVENADGTTDTFHIDDIGDVFIQKGDMFEPYSSSGEGQDDSDYIEVAGLKITPKQLPEDDPYDPPEIIYPDYLQISETDDSGAGSYPVADIRITPRPLDEFGNPIIIDPDKVYPNSLQIVEGAIPQDFGAGSYQVAQSGQIGSDAIGVSANSRQVTDEITRLSGQLEEAREEIIRLLNDRRKAENVQKWLDEEMSKAEVEIVEPDLYKLVAVSD